MTQHWQDRFSDWLRNFFVSEEYNRKMKEIEDEKFFVEGLGDKGYAYDTDNEWYARKWTTNNGEESILEVYQKLENGEWNKLMIGYGDRVFFEENVGKP
jgi:hypothetical protein